MHTATILKSYTTQYTDPIIVKAGQHVALGEEEQEEKWKGWIRASNNTHEGWLPIQILRVSEDRKTGVVLSDYTAQELDVEANDTVEKIQALNGWTWCRNLRTHKEGWIPDEIIA